MTVIELIRILCQFPPDAKVVAYDASEDSSILGPSGIEYDYDQFWENGKLVNEKVVSIIGSDGN